VLTFLWLLLLSQSRAMTSPHNAWLNRFLAWLMKVVGIKKTQVIYTSGESYAMDDDMNAEVTAELILNRHTLAFSSCFLFLPSRARSPTHSPTHPLTHSPTHPLTHSPTHPLTHSPIALFSLKVIAKLKSIIMSSQGDKFMFVPYVLPRLAC
jgi:hypothetical protein